MGELWAMAVAISYYLGMVISWVLLAAILVCGTGLVGYFLIQIFMDVINKLYGVYWRWELRRACKKANAEWKGM